MLALLTVAAVSLVPTAAPAAAEKRVALKLQEFSREHWPETFGGLWIRRPWREGEHLAVAFTRRVEKRREVIMRLFMRPGVYIKVVRVDLTEKDIARIQNDIVRRVDKLPLRSWGVGQDIIHNRVSVTIPKRMPRFEAHLRYLYGPGNVHFEYGVITAGTG